MVFAVFRAVRSAARCDRLRAVAVLVLRMFFFADAAQAIAARSYALAGSRHPGQGADVCTTTHCQVWRPEHYARTDQAVEETKGLVALIEDPQARVFLCNSGTEAVEAATRASSNGHPFALVLLEHAPPTIDAGAVAMFTEKYGEVCPANWRHGDEAMKATAEGVAKYLARHA